MTASYQNEPAGLIGGAAPVSPDATQPPLRVAAVVTGERPPLWQVELIERLENEPFVEVSVALAGAPADASETGLLRAYERRDRRYFRIDPDPLEPTAVRATMAFDELIRKGADVALWLARSEPPPELAARTQHGLWSLRGDDALHALAGRERLVETTIQAVFADGVPRVLYSSRSAASEPRSMYRYRSLACRKAAEAFVQRLHTVHRLGPRWRESLPDLARVLPAPPDSLASPRTVAVLRLAGRAGAAELRRRGLRRPQERWFLAHRPAAPFPPGDPDGLTPVTPPDGHFFADPFLLASDGRTHVFFEDFDHALGRGTIAHLEIDDSGRASIPTTILEGPDHLSYPFVFEHGGEIYLVPETARRRRIELYRATRFPTEWTLDRVLMDGIAAVDTTLLFEGGRIWLFTLINPPGVRANSELYLFSADRLDGPWTAHPQNPVVSDARCARPAGRIQRIGESLIRPAQDCSARYGYAIEFRVIETITETAYREAPLARLTPERLGVAATHTYDRTASREIIDCLAHPSGVTASRRRNSQS